MIEISLRILLIINASFIFVLFMLGSYLLFQKDSDQKRINRKEKLKSKLRLPLFHYIDGGVELKTRLFQRDPLNYEVAQELLSEVRL